MRTIRGRTRVVRCSVAGQSRFGSHFRLLRGAASVYSTPTVATGAGRTAGRGTAAAVACESGLAAGARVRGRRPRDRRPAPRVGARGGGGTGLAVFHIAAASWERAELWVHTNPTRSAAGRAPVGVRVSRASRTRAT